MSQPSSSPGARSATRDDFVGREPELAKIGTLLLDSTRLITLTGPGGIGKTRLASEAVYRYRKTRRVPVYWARLARVTKGSSAATVEDELAQAIVDVDFSDRTAWEAIIETLGRADSAARSSQTILVMDNCEHVSAGAGQVIAELLESLPELTILATSREAIGWVDEHPVVVPPLAQEHGVTLFRNRAELTDYAVEDADLALVGSICTRLHNHPLYIRLAAARLRRQPLSMILRDLSGGGSDRRLRWSHDSRISSEERHRGIGDVIAWSFDLCSAEEQLLFERMSVFASGYDGEQDSSEIGAELDAIEAVCADDGSGAVGIPRDEIENLVDRLVDQSLITVHRTPNMVRFSLLESMRLFAEQRLREHVGPGEPARLARLHRRHYRDRLVRAQREWFSAAEQDVLDWARAAWDNIRSAIDTSVTEPAEAVIGLEIATGLLALRAPFFKGSLREPRRWAERMLRATSGPREQPIELQVSALSLIAWISVCQGDHDEARRMLDEAVVSYSKDPNGIEEWRRLPRIDQGLPAPIEYARGCELMLAERNADAIVTLARAREKFAAAGDLGGEAMSHLFQSMAAGFYGTPDQALNISREYLDKATRSQARWVQSWAMLSQAIALTEHGDPNEALTVGRAALAEQVAMRDQWGGIWAVHIRAWSLARLIADCAAPTGTGETNRRREQALEIARLLGGAATWRGRLGVNLENLGPFAVETQVSHDVARNMLGNKAFTDAWHEGSLLRPELDEVARLALGTLSMNRLPLSHPVQVERPSRWAELTHAEREVALLAAAGWTNVTIAARRGTSYRTVDAQMISIRQKLMIASRNDIVAGIPIDQRDRVIEEAQRRPKSRGRSNPRLR